ncbi:MAG TPA: hypothetical protein VFZ34_17355 [Blastocatellia bacterium]|nr:hypothetical protein [Blastocatellia bacterium]
MFTPYLIGGGSEAQFVPFRGIELLPKLQTLPRVEKLRVVQFLISELAREESLQPLTANSAFPIWSPYEASEAAILQGMLEEEKRGQHG